MLHQNQTDPRSTPMGLATLQRISVSESMPIQYCAWQAVTKKVDIVCNVHFWVSPSQNGIRYLSETSFVHDKVNTHHLNPFYYGGYQCLLEKFIEFYTDLVL